MFEGLFGCVNSLEGILDPRNVEDKPFFSVYFKGYRLCRNLSSLHFQDGEEAGRLAMISNKRQFDDPVSKALYFRKRFCGDGPGGTCREEYSSGLLDFGSDCLEKSNRLFTFDAVENRRERVEDQGHRFAFGVAYD